MLKRKRQGSKTKVAREQDIPTQLPPNSQLNKSDGEKVDSDDESEVNRDVSLKGKRYAKHFTQTRNSCWSGFKRIIFCIIKA